MTETKSAILHTATIAVKVIKIDKKQLTLATFRQLPERNIFHLDSWPTVDSFRSLLEYEECKEDDEDDEDDEGGEDDEDMDWYGYGYSCKTEEEWENKLQIRANALEKIKVAAAARMRVRIKADWEKGEEETEYWLHLNEVDLLGIPWGWVNYTWATSPDWVDNYLVWEDNNKLFRTPIPLASKLPDMTEMFIETATDTDCTEKADVADLLWRYITGNSPLRRENDVYSTRVVSEHTDHLMGLIRKRLREFEMLDQLFIGV